MDQEEVPMDIEGEEFSEDEEDQPIYAHEFADYDYASDVETEDEEEEDL